MVSDNKEIVYILIVVGIFWISQAIYPTIETGERFFTSLALISFYIVLVFSLGFYIGRIGVLDQLIKNEAQK